MKRYMALFAVAAVLAGCKDYSYETWSPDESFHRTGEVTLLATFENLETKVYMDDKGHGVWEREDKIAVACSDGSFVEFVLDGTGDTKRATFKGTIPSGKEIGGVAVYPASAVVSLSGEDLTLKVPGKYDTSSGYTGIMIAAIKDSWQVDFKQALGFLRLNMSNYPGEAERVLLASPDGALSGTFKSKVSDMLERGIRPSDAVDGSGAELVVKSAGKSVLAFLPVPASDYSAINASFIDADGAVVIAQPLSDYAVGVSRAELCAMNVVCSEVQAPPCRINLDGRRVKMEESVANVYEGEFEIPASTSFTIELDGVPYGFATGSGAGGLGIISSKNSALPVGAIKTAGKSKLTYYVKRAIGTMSPIEIADNPFTVELESPGKIRVVADVTDPSAPRYRINVVRAEDPSVIFHEDFDLCTMGGDYIAPAAGIGSKVDVYDGYLPASASVTQNVGNFPFDYPDDTSSAAEALPSYMQAYGLQDWVFTYAAERPGAMQLCAGTIAGAMTTPAFSAVQGTADALIEIDIARFSTTSTDPVYIKLLGGGSFKAASITRDAYVSAKTGSSFEEASGSYSQFSDGGATLAIPDNDLFPHSWDNADVDKPVSHLRMDVSGITPSTRLMIDCPKGEKNAPRIFVFDIKVTKK